jgi:hypothetical protein
MGSTESKRTSACEGVYIICTGGSIFTRVRCTIIFICLTILAIKSRYTETSIVTSPIKTGSTIQARRISAVISIDNTVTAFKSFSTQALIASFGVNTGSTISARRRCLAFINILITISTSETYLAGAGKVSVATVWAADSTI